MGNLSQYERDNGKMFLFCVVLNWVEQKLEGATSFMILSVEVHKLTL
jgi:hypothetical protein